MSRLDPNSVKRERPNWGGIPVIMADGQVWTLARPVVRRVPTDDDIGFQVTLVGDQGEKFEELVDRYDRLWSDEANSDFTEMVRCEIGLGKCLLLTNYDLTTKQLAKILAFGYGDGDEVGRGIRDAVVAIAFGNDGPKPSAVGDE